MKHSKTGTTEKPTAMKSKISNKKTLQLKKLEKIFHPDLSEQRKYVQNQVSTTKVKRKNPQLASCSATINCKIFLCYLEQSEDILLSVLLYSRVPHFRARDIWRERNKNTQRKE